MTKFTTLLALFLFSAIACRATQSFVAREPFIGPGTLTTTAPGSNFNSVSGTINLVRVGPRTSAIAAPGWSADFRTPGAANVRGSITLSGAAATYGMWGTWMRIKNLPPSGGYASVLQLIGPSATEVDFKINSSGVLSTQPYNSGGVAPTFTGPTIPVNKWVWVAVAWHVYSGSGFPYDVQCLYMPVGGTLTSWGSATGLNALATSFSSVNVGLQTGGTGVLLRLGCPSLYSIANMTLTGDLAYPADIIPPVEQSNNWYVNPSTGSDNNDGSTAATAWKTADKITTESQYCGMLDSNAAGPGGGDVLNIDTSAAPLVIDTNTLIFATQGLKVQPVSGQTYIKCQAEEFLANAAFTPTAGSSKTFQTTDTQLNVVAWENDKWMYHVRSASFGASASVNNLQTQTLNTYTTTLAALDANPGSFYTDGTTLYIHPFGDTSPKTDGNTYTRSLNRGLVNNATGGGLAAVEFTAGNFRAIGFYVRKTALVDSGDNDFGGYCFQDGVLSGSGFSSSVESGYFAYGDKHCFGSTAGVTASTLLVLNTECEQGQPYCEYGGQTPFVSYTGATTGDIVHTYQGCTCLARSGLVGSTAGDPVGTGGDIILSHNNAGGISFASITLSNCNFASGSATMGVANTLAITNKTQIGNVNTSCPNTNIQQTTFGNEIVSMDSGATNLTVQNCLIKPTFTLSPAPAYFGLIVSGNVKIQGCTFDLSGISGNSAEYFAQGIIQRTSTLNLTFENNVYLVPAGENLPLLYNASSTDTLTFDHNAYNLGGGTILARSYQGTTGKADQTFAQWQALGMDCVNSSLNANLLLTNDVPQLGSPLFNEGIDLGSTEDVTGTLYAHRNTIGAYEGSTTYLAPQSISNFLPIQSAAFGPGNTSTVTLPAKTSAGLTITYQVVSGSATISGDTLTIGSVDPIMVVATQAGNSTYASLSETETIIPSITSDDSPTMPAWGLAVLAGLLVLVALRQPRRV